MTELALLIIIRMIYQSLNLMVNRAPKATSTNTV
jgi:hypothetical protein